MFNCSKPIINVKESQGVYLEENTEVILKNTEAIK